MKISLKDKVILVTGGSRGIGAAIVKTLAASDGTVAIHYHQSAGEAERLAKACKNRSKTFAADLKSPEECRDLVHQVIDHYGRLDVLVNNAGIALPVNPQDSDDAWLSTWLMTLQVNLVAAAMLTRHAIQHFKQQGNGRLIHITSRAAFRGDTPEYMAYAASKGGLVAYSRSIARGYGKDGIKSFVVAPGFTKTDMADQFVEKYGERLLLDDIALNSMTEPEDIAPTVLFLASGHMDHATGCTIDINAGSYVR
ncbi:SDR family oxidoreductase [Pontibacter sp. G13]|uniref:SDR family NAD(P)-dependent oxidoreductase n=1 Tax=Pontibacter sp. G13 TaxID=3074898 RepID=UPI00288B660D|nr:SDR family oxidoreductase [Pontibacter sp. G13]WNJ18881.1 SDR family oxidoreductase [Pontibacter sp. G13]